MTKFNLDDERLRGIIRALDARSTVWRDSVDAITAIEELLRLRATGPVMPETPSEPILQMLRDCCDPNAQIYNAIRATLTKEQGRQTAKGSSRAKTGG
jgi:hypothetical protein